jgi:small-conductance mechanosensitive channel
MISEQPPAPNGVKLAQPSNRSITAFTARLLEALLILGVIILLLWLINWLYRRAVHWVDTRPVKESPPKYSRFSGLRRTGFYRSGRWKRPARGALNLIRWGLMIAVLLIGVPMLLKGFPTTQEAAEQLMNLVLAPLSLFWDWLVSYTDELITILLIGGGAYLLIRLVRWFFGEVESGGLRIKSLDPTQARFTAGIISTLIAIGAAVMIFPYLPGAESPAFRAVVIFAGALFTFASTSAIANTVSGILLVYTDAFVVGDIVQIGQVQGKVAAQHVLTTELRTERNEMISIPNAVVLNSYVTNYSRLGSDDGLVAAATITVGYDAPWKQVHELLIAAARATPDVLDKPAPFVLQTALNDYNVSYQLNFFTRVLERLLITQSNLHANIQDRFNEAGVELLSPAFTALRDGNTTTIPEANRPPGYQPSGFRIFK